MSKEMELNSLLEEAQQMLSTVGDVITSTMQQGVDAIKNYEELASNKVLEVTEARKKELADLSSYGESVKSCAENRQKDFEKVEETLRKELAACYAKHYGSLGKILAEKSTIHEEAKRIKNELQEAMSSCMSAENKTDCFLGVLNNLKKKLNALSSRMGEVLKKETEVRLKATKAVFECDKKAMDDAGKKSTTILNDVKLCASKKDESTTKSNT